MVVETKKIIEYIGKFSEAVDKKEYVKIPYQTYRRFWSCLKCYKIVELSIEQDFSFSSTIHNELPKCEVVFNFGVVGEIFKFNSQDSSFGNFFLYRTNFNELIKEDKKDMTYNTATISTTGTNGVIRTNIDSSELYGYDKGITTIKTNSVGWDKNENNINIKSNGTITCKTLETDKIIIKGEGNRTMKGFNFDFGAVDGNKIHMSMYGMAVKNAAGTWVSYDKDNKDIIDVDILNFDAGKFMFKMPVAVKEVAVGDVIIHNRVPMFVTKVNDTSFTAVDVYAGEEKNIIPTKNMFGFNFVTKVVSFIDMNGMSADTPFGNMLPFMLMSDNKDIDPMMLMMMMGNGNFDMSNPMMMYFMMKDSKDNDMLPLLMMMAPKPHVGDCGKDATCNCGNPPTKA